MITSTPKISIILPCYNAELYLHSTIESITQQTFKDYELIIIDDSSTDNSQNIIESYNKKYSYIKTIFLKNNSGQSNARNIGIKRAKAKLIALIDADDLWHKDKLVIQYKHHLEKNCGISCTGYQFGQSKVLNAKTDYISLLKNNVINTSSIMFNKSNIKINFTSEDKSEDYIAWLDIAKKTNIHFINELLIERRVFSGISSDKIKMAKQRWKIYREIEKLSTIRSIYFMTHYIISGLIKYANK